MCAPNPPPPSNPNTVAKAQTGTNVATALANSYLNNVNQYGPDGNVTWRIRGFRNVGGAGGRRVPLWSQYTTLSGMARKIKGQTDQTKLDLAKLASSQAGRLDGLLSEPFDLNNGEVEARLFDLGSKRLNPRFAQQRGDLQQSLINRGLREGTAAWDAAMRSQYEGENDAFNQLALTGRGQAIQEKLTERNQPLNEIAALLSGSQVSMPQFGPTNQYNIPTTDRAGIYANYDNMRMQQWQAQMANRQAMMGGLFSLLLDKRALLSDKRAKTKVRKIGKTNDGLGLYSYKYKPEFGDPRTHVGVMAQEVKKVKPEAVTKRPDGLFAVDYEKALA